VTITVLDDIPFEIDFEVLLSRARVDRDSGHYPELQRLADQAQAIACPKAVYKVGFIGDRGQDHVAIDGMTFTSRILRVNLEQAHRIFLYVATCGVEIAAWAGSLDDLLHRYWAEAIQVMALRCASQAMNRHIDGCYRPGKTSFMSPGSLGDWPLSQQRPLFASLGDVRAKIGVRLSDSLLMVPAKSVSGIRFPAEESFESCQLCSRENCPGRRSPYDEALYDRKYRA
jgi:hypothetical protein